MPLIRTLVFVVLVSLAIQVVYTTAVYVVDSGVLKPASATGNDRDAE